MTDKELHRLKRTDLLEILLEQRQEIENLSQDLESTQAKLEERTHALNNAEEVSEAVVALCSAFAAWTAQPDLEGEGENEAENLAAAMQLLQEKTAGLKPLPDGIYQDGETSQTTFEVVAVAEQLLRQQPFAGEVDD